MSNAVKKWLHLSQTTIFSKNFSHDLLPSFVLFPQLTVFAGPIVLLLLLTLLVFYDLLIIVNNV